MTRSFKSNVAVTGDLTTTGQLNVTASAGDEGGQIFLANAVANTAISTGVNIDVYQNKLRFWEAGGTNRGYYVDITSGGAGAGTSLTGGSTGAMNYTQTQATKQSGVSSNATTIVSTSSFTTNGYPVQVLVTGDAENSAAGAWVKLQLFRDSTAIGKIVHVESSAASENIPYALTVIDTPAAGAYVYSLKTVSATAGGTFNFGETDGPVITAIELSGPKGDTGSAGASSNSFSTISTPSGTNPVATSATDTLTFTASNGITITGTASTDSIAIATNASSSNGASTLVSRDSLGNFTANLVSATTFNGSGSSLTNIPAANVTGTLTSTVLGNSTIYVGTTAVALNRGSANQDLTGISSITLPGSTSGTAIIQANAAAGSGTTITLPSSTGTLALTSQLPTINDGTLTLGVSGVGLSGSQTFTANQSGPVTFTVTSNASDANGASTLVARNASGNFTANTITANLTGTAAYATTVNAVSQVTGLQTSLDDKFSVTPTALGTTDDLNTKTTPGLYHQASNANAGTGTNYPAALAGLLTVYTSGLYYYQTYQAYGTSNRKFFRGYYNSTWSSWKEEITTGDTGTVTNTMLAGSIANAKLANTTVTIGSTAVTLGGTSTSLAGITTISMSGQLTSTVANATAPLVVSSVTAVANLTASYAVRTAIYGTAVPSLPSTANMSKIYISAAASAPTDAAVGDIWISY